MRNFKILFLLLILAVPVCAAKIKNGEQLVTAMHKKYEGKWYKTLTFVQKNTEYKPDGTVQNSVWYEAMSAPGNLRIDFDPLEKGDGLMFTGGAQHNFKDGKLAASRPTIHPLMVLAFDVYTQPVDKSVAQLKELKMDLSILREDKWQNRDVYVVGAKADDQKSPQFWIDKKNLYFVRMIQPAGKNKERVAETQFNKYQKTKGGGWIAPEVVFTVDGKRTFLEEYTDIQTDVELDNKLFDPNHWMTVDRTYFRKKDLRGATLLPEFLKKNGYVRIPLARNATGHFYTGGFLNERPVSMLVDSGAAYTTVVNHDVAKEINLSLTKLAKYGGGAGAAKLDLYQIEKAQFEVGSFKPKAFDLMTMDLTNVNQSLKLNGAGTIDVILGADVFEAHQAVIDYSSSALYLKL